MKKLFYTLIALSITPFILANGPGGGEYKVDNKLSAIEWVGKKVTGQHSGTISVKDGSIQVEDGKIVGGKLIIDMNTIVVTDIDDKETNAKLLGHLQSEDFFGVTDFPTAQLDIDKVVHKEGDLHHVHGDLTIKGITHKVEVPTTVKMEGNKLVAVGETDIDRTLYKIKYGSGKFFDDLGDRMIYDDFTVKFKVGATK